MFIYNHESDNDERVISGECGDRINFDLKYLSCFEVYFISLDF